MQTKVTGFKVSHLTNAVELGVDAIKHWKANQEPRRVVHSDMLCMCL